MRTSEQALAAKVRAINRAHAEANGLYPAMAEALRPFIGQKVLCGAGIAAKLKKALPVLPCTPGLHVYYNNQDARFGWVVKVSEMVDECSCLYFEAKLPVGKLEHCTLVGIESAPNLRTDYTAEEITQKRAAYRAACDAASKAQSALHPFYLNDE